MLRPIVRVVWAAALVALAAPAQVAGQTTFAPSLTVTESYSDNVDANPEDREEAAFLTDVVPAFSLRRRSARLNSALDVALTGRHQTAGEDEGVQVLPFVAGFSTLEVSEDFFFVDASSSVSQELLNTRQTDAESNRGTVQNYSLSPYLRERFGSFADGELRYTLRKSFESGDDTGGANGSLSDSTSHDGRATLTSGAEFSSLHWSLTAGASKTERIDDDNVNRRDVALDVEYVVVRSFSLLGSAGYQKFDDGDSENEIDGPTWRAGFHWRPGRRLDLRATYGKSDNETSFNANASYRLGPRTTITAGYRERLETGQERLSRDLTFIGADPDTGLLIDTRTGLPFDPNTSATSLSDDTERTKTLNAAISGTRGRNTFSVSGIYETSQPEGTGLGGNDETAVGLNGAWTRKISPRASLLVSGGYLRSEFESDNRTDDEYTASGTLTYVIRDNLTAFASYLFNRQDSTDLTNEFTENRITAGIQMGF